MALDKAKIVEELSNATVIEIAELVKELETKWGVSAAAPAAAAAAAYPDVKEPDAACRELRAAGAGLPPVTVPPVSDEVTRVEQACEVIHDLTGCSAGGQHQPHRPGSGKVPDHRGHRASSPHARAAGLIQDME